MPYEGEFAKQRALKRIIENRRVQEILGKRMQVKGRSADVPKTKLKMLELAELSPSYWEPQLLLAVDGSYDPVPIENGYPGAEVGYVAVASVLTDIAKVRELDSARPVDPRQYRTTEEVDSVDWVFPGCNIVLDDLESSRHSLRKALFEMMSETRIPPESGDTLLGTYHALIRNRKVSNQTCPYGDDCLRPGKQFDIQMGEYQCGCVASRPLYSTDALRVHEAMLPNGENGQMYSEIMQSIERLLVLHLLRWMEKNDYLRLLRYTAIIMDGPLAFFGNPAALQPYYMAELRRINEAAKAFTNGQDMLLMGVEKSGLFVNHFERLDKNTNGTEGAFPRQTVGLLTDQYIKDHIIYTRGDSKPYGKDTYFGRKFFYKTRSGARIVGTLPLLSDTDGDTRRADPAQYRRLGDAARLLDQVVSNRFPNAIFPLITANAEASIPLNSRSLEELTRRLVKKIG